MWLEFNKYSGEKFNTKIIPMNSEHYSIWKLIEKHNLNEIQNIYNCLGGPLNLIKIS